jgi:hypothetical protein
MNKFDKLCNQLIQEQYTITAREVLYRRYGRDNAERMISSIRSRGKDNYLEKKYVLPDYSNKTLDRVIPVVFKDLSGSRPNVKGFATQYFPLYPQSITINTNLPKGAIGAGDELRELQTGEPPQQGYIPKDTLGHERIHTQQKANLDHPLKNEFAPVLAELKFWYYKKTGIVLDANATDDQINQFINYCKRYNAFNNTSYGDQIDFEKLLRTSEGKEVFRRVVKQAPMKSNTMVA